MEEGQSAEPRIQVQLTEAEIRLIRDRLAMAVKYATTDDYMEDWDGYDFIMTSDELCTTRNLRLKLGFYLSLAKKE